MNPFRIRPKKRGTPNLFIKGFERQNILPEDVVKAVFLKWEIEARLNPTGFKRRDMLSLQSADDVAEANTKQFLKYADEMGINHP